MPIKYKAYRKRNPINAKDLYYAHALKTGTVGTNDISERIAYSSSLTPGDVKSTIVQFVSVMKMYLAMGCHVKLEEFGIFSVSATSEGCETEEACTPRKVQANRLCFLPDAELKEFLKTIKFEKE